MAGGWRSLLEEESEHQWLAISAFFVFIIISAVFISGTKSLDGVELGLDDMAHENSRVLDIAYTDSENGFPSHFALIYNPGVGYHFYEQIDAETISLIYSPDYTDKGADIRFMEELSDGSIVISTDDNQIHTFKDGTLITTDYSNQSGEFAILDYAQSKDDVNSAMMVVAEQGGSAIRAVGPNLIPTSAVSTAEDMTWSEVISLGDGIWIASGALSSPLSDNPASPQTKPLIAVLEWNGQSSAPIISTIITGDSGQSHTLLNWEDSAFIAGTIESYIVNANGEVETLEMGSSAAVIDSDGKVWLFPAIGSTTLATYDGEVKVLPLEHDLPINVDLVRSEGDFIYAHGTDAKGDWETLTIDISAASSIESGRGMLNFGFLVLGTIALVTMLWTAWERSKNF